MARTAVVAVLATVLTAALLPRTFTATSAFVPESRKGGSSLSGLAAQLGVAVPTSDAAESPQFYSDLIRSREILRLAAAGKYLVGKDSEPLVAALDIGPAGSPYALDRAVRWLVKRVAASPAAKTGVITVTVVAPSASLAQQINARLLTMVNEFNLRTRQTQASAERKFAEQRVAELRSELRAAEDGLRDFLQHNRGDLRSAPDLQFQQERLAREVQLRQQVYSTVVQSYEQARLEEVRDTPVITVLDSPELPLAPDGRGLAAKVIFSLILGTLLGALLAVARAGFNGSLTAGEVTSDELATLAAGTLADLRRPWSLIARSATAAGMH